MGVERLVVYSRDELKHFHMSQTYGEAEFPAIRYFLGDVRDKDRLRRALEGIDVVVHAAAIKQVPAAEYNPFECIKTNVLGAQNVIEEQNIIRLNADSAKKFFDAIDNPPAPNEKLLAAFRSHRELL